ncbi:MAG: ATP-binding cassette domain-containing protein [Ornithinibacter sp.]
MTGAAPAARLRGVERRFADRAAVAGVDLTILPGERVGLLGPSGAGKSTLLGLLGGSLPPSSGSVEVLGTDLTGIPGGRLRALQLRIGTISQRLDLVDQVRVLHNVNAGRIGRWSTPRALWELVTPRADPVAVTALERVGLAWAVHERTERLSGGERQRVAIARLLVQEPELVLADEPVSSLDPTRASEVLDLLSAATPTGTLVVSLHQPELARRHCTRVIGLQHGQVVLDLPVERLDDATLLDLYAMT